MIEFSQNKPRALHVDKRMCSGLLLLFSTEEFLCDLSQNLSVQRGLGDNNDGLKKIVTSLSNNSVLRG